MPARTCLRCGRPPDRGLYCSEHYERVALAARERARRHCVNCDARLGCGKIILNECGTAACGERCATEWRQATGFLATLTGRRAR